MELYKKYRPTKLSDVLGQDAVVHALENKIRNKEVPHTILLSGESGIGKTTIARILAKELGCEEEYMTECNASSTRGIDFAKSLIAEMNNKPLVGSCKIYLLDEAHNLTSDAQNALLKALEDTPSHVYFILTTTDKKKLIKAVRTRCWEIDLSRIDDDAIGRLVRKVSRLESIKISPEVLDRIIDHSHGSARVALVYLDSINGIDDESAKNLINSLDETEKNGIILCRLLFDKNSKWVNIAKALSDTEDIDPETVRYTILAYARKALLGNNQLAAVIINEFKDTFINSKQAGLALACWNVKNA